MLLGAPVIVLNISARVRKPLLDPRLRNVPKYSPALFNVSKKLGNNRATADTVHTCTVHLLVQNFFRLLQRFRLN